VEVSTLFEQMAACTIHADCHSKLLCVNRYWDMIWFKFLPGKPKL